MVTGEHFRHHQKNQPKKTELKIISKLFKKTNEFGSVFVTNKKKPTKTGKYFFGSVFVTSKKRTIKNKPKKQKNNK